MESTTILVILACAMATALLNCCLRNEEDPLAAAFMVAIGGAVVALPTLCFVGLPDAASAPYLAISTVLGCVYWIVLGRAYAAGEVGLIYPLAYGSAPIWILMLSTMVFQETLPPKILAVILLISIGLFIVLFSSADRSKLLDRNVFLRSASVTIIICAYTLCDALAVRTIGNPIGYTIFLYASSGTVVFIYALVFHKKRLTKAFTNNHYLGLLWGSISLVNYCGELWAMTRAPVALVAALRETSILFAIVIAIVWLREPVRPGRIAGAGVVAFGLVLMRLT